MHLRGGQRVLCWLLWVQADQLRKISEMHEEMLANNQRQQVREGVQW